MNNEKKYLDYKTWKRHQDLYNKFVILPIMYVCSILLIFNYIVYIQKYGLDFGGKFILVFIIGVIIGAIYSNYRVYKGNIPNASKKAYNRYVKEFLERDKLDEKKVIIEK